MNDRVVNDRAEMMLAAEPARVWATLADVPGWRRWMPAVRWAVLEGELAPGAYVTIKPERGRQTAYRVRTAAGNVLALELTFGPVAALCRTWRLEADGAGTRAIATVEIAGPLRRWLVAGAARRTAAAAPALLAALREAVDG